MAQRRMFSPEIVCSDDFLEMPPSSRDLYYQLAIRADDDGFIQPKSTMKVVGSSPDDLKILLAKRFLLPFESGVVVIKHWLIHNMIRADRYKPTRFQDEKNTLYLKDNKAYTDNPENGKPLLATKWQPNGNHPAPQVRLGKVNTSVANAPLEFTITTENPKDPKNTPEMLSLYGVFTHNPARATWKGRTHQREAAKVILSTWGLEEARRRYAISQKYKSEPMCPQFDSPSDMLDKMVKMENFLKSL